MSRGWKIGLAVFVALLIVWFVSGAIVRNGFCTTKRVCQHFHNPSLKGQTVIVTGANSGIGLRGTGTPSAERTSSLRADREKEV